MEPTGMRVVEYLLRALEAQGVRQIFGNPGTTEIPLVRACEGRERLAYVVALSEVAAVPMADGCARATRGLGVVNLHVAPGLGNGIGNLYTASIAKTPLLVLIGGQDRRLRHTGPILDGPLEEMVRPVVKTVHVLSDARSAEFHIRRAIRSALTPPTGPAALVCPPDLLDEELTAPAPAPGAVAVPGLGTLADDEVERYASFLRSAARPALIAAEDIHWAGAGPALQRLARALDAPVYVAPYTAVSPIDTRSPAYAGYLSPGYAGIGERLADHDALLFAGFRNFRTTLYSAPALAQRKAWIGHDPSLYGAEGEFELARLADLRRSLESIAVRLEPGPPAARVWQAAVPVPQAQPGVFHPTRAIAALLEAFADALVFDEAGLSTSDVRQYVAARAGDYLINGSGGIGWGLAAAVGGALGCPERQVLAIVGDGSSLYASEALWTAAHRGAKLLLVILSNRRYATLNEAATRLTGQPIELFTIEPPAIDFSGLATLYGLDFVRAADEPALHAFLRRSAGRVERCTLLELCFDPSIRPVTASRHF
jgi:benzoylformate decarboxylase